MKKIIATAAVAATLFSASVSEAGYQSVYGAAFSPVEQEEPAPQEQTKETKIDYQTEQAMSPVEQEPVTSQTVNEQREQRRQRAIEQGLVRVNAIGYADIGDRAGAMDDAQRNAVENVLSTMLKPDNSPDSVYQKICDQYDLYIVSFNITSTQDINGALEMNAKVTVNSRDLQAAVDAATKPSSAPTSAVDANISNNPSVGVLLRFVGSRNSQQADSLTSDAYRNAMHVKDLNLVVDDDLQGRISGYSALSFEDFSMLMKQYASSSAVGMKFAVIGEVNTDAVLEDDTGVTQKASVRMVLYDLVNNRHLGDMKEDYFARGTNGAEAEPAVIKKAAAESSRILAQEISRYIEMTKSSAI